MTAEKASQRKKIKDSCRREIEAMADSKKKGLSEKEGAKNQNEKRKGQRKVFVKNLQRRQNRAFIVLGAQDTSDGADG